MKSLTGEIVTAMKRILVYRTVPPPAHLHNLKKEIGTYNSSDSICKTKNLLLGELKIKIKIDFKTLPSLEYITRRPKSYAIGWISQITPVKQLPMKTGSGEAYQDNMS